VSGQADAEFLAFVTSSRAELRRVAFLMCRDWHQAEDITQDALVSLYANWDRIAEPARAMPYARKVVLRKLLDQRRRPWRREVAVTLPDLPSGKDELAAMGEREILLGALAALPAGRRACIVLRYFEELSVAEAAEVIGCSVGNVKSQTARGITELRTVLTAAGITYLGLMEGVLA
jgi:RNA polymerase sigma-70 factor (sigma-E family)